MASLISNATAAPSSRIRPVVSGGDLYVVVPTLQWRIALFRSQDGGATWAQLGFENLLTSVRDRVRIDYYLAGSTIRWITSHDYLAPAGKTAGSIQITVGTVTLAGSFTLDETRTISLPAGAADDDRGVGIAPNDGPGASSYVGIYIGSHRDMGTDLPTALSVHGTPGTRTWDTQIGATGSTTAPATGGASETQGAANRTHLSWWTGTVNAARTQLGASTLSATTFSPSELRRQHFSWNPRLDRGMAALRSAATANQGRFPTDDANQDFFSWSTAGTVSTTSTAFGGFVDDGTKTWTAGATSDSIVVSGSTDLSAWDAPVTVETGLTNSPEVLGSAVFVQRYGPLTGHRVLGIIYTRTSSTDIYYTEYDLGLVSINWSDMLATLNQRSDTTLVRQTNGTYTFVGLVAAAVPNVGGMLALWEATSPTASVDTGAGWTLRGYLSPKGGTGTRTYQSWDFSIAPASNSVDIATNHSDDSTNRFVEYAQWNGATKVWNYTQVTVTSNVVPSGGGFTKAHIPFIVSTGEGAFIATNIETGSPTGSTIRLFKVTAGSASIFNTIAGGSGNWLRTQGLQSNGGAGAGLRLHWTWVNASTLTTAEFRVMDIFGTIGGGDRTATVPAQGNEATINCGGGQTLLGDYSSWVFNDATSNLTTCTIVDVPVDNGSAPTVSNVDVGLAAFNRRSVISKSGNDRMLVWTSNSNGDLYQRQYTAPWSTWAAAAEVLFDYSAPTLQDNALLGHVAADVFYFIHHPGSGNNNYYHEYTIPATGGAVNATDNLGLTDSHTTQRTVVRDTSNNLGLTDSITTELVAVRDVSDNLGLTDSALAERLLFRDYSDDLDLTDAKSRIEIAPSLDRQDSLDLTDSFAQDITLDRSDSLGLTDALDPFAQTVDDTDNLGITDTGKRIDWIGDISNDAIGLTDSITAETFLGVDATDNLGLTDSVVFDVALDRQDDLDLTDATDPFGFTVDDSDNLNLTDSFTVEIGFARDYTDTLGLTDTASDDSGEAHSDDLDLTDVATWQADLDRDDPLGLTDSISLELGEAVDASDTLGLTDSISFTQDFGPDVSDSLDLTDSDERVWDATRDFSDNLGLTDSFTTEFAGAGTLDTSNNLGLTDSITVELTVTVDTADTLGLTDSFSLEIGYTLDLSDSLDLTDAAAFDSGVELDFSDNLGLTDSVAAVRSFGVSLSDDLGLTDTVETALTKPAVELVDTVALSDSISRVANYIRDFSDAVGLSDTRQYGWNLPNVDDPGRTSRTDRAGRTHDQGRLGSTTATNRRGMTATSNSKTYTHD